MENISKKTHKKTNNLAQHSAIHFFYTTFTARFVPKPLIQGYRMKRESGESPEQSRCCEPSKPHTESVATDDP